jgi:hypothetical protein
MAFEPEFYVYRIFHGDMTLYVGKGCGSRLAKQKRDFGVDGEIIARFEREDDAFREEVRLIAEMQPPLNRHPGGQGGRAGMFEREIPNGFTEEGLAHAAFPLARIILSVHRSPERVGLLGILAAYVNAHGLDKIEAAVMPSLKRLLHSDLAIQGNP